MRSNDWTTVTALSFHQAKVHRRRSSASMHGHTVLAHSVTNRCDTPHPVQPQHDHGALRCALRSPRRDACGSVSTHTVIAPREFAMYRSRDQREDLTNDVHQAMPNERIISFLATSACPCVNSASRAERTRVKSSVVIARGIAIALCLSAILADTNDSACCANSATVHAGTLRMSICKNPTSSSTSCVVTVAMDCSPYASAVAWALPASSRYWARTLGPQHRRKIVTPLNRRYERSITIRTDSSYVAWFAHGTKSVRIVFKSVRIVRPALAVPVLRESPRRRRLHDLAQHRAVCCATECAHNIAEHRESRIGGEPLH